MATDIPVELLPNEQVRALRDMQMSDDQQQELSNLLVQQREQTLDSDGRMRLDALLDLYRRGW